MPFTPSNLTPITETVFPELNETNIDALGILPYNFNVSSLIEENEHYYYVDNLRLYKFDWITKTLIYIRSISTSYGGEYPTLYKTSDGSIYGYSNVGGEYNHLLYSEEISISFFEQDTALDVPSSKIILSQDLEVFVSVQYNVNIDTYIDLKIYVEQDVNVNIIKSRIIIYQDTLLKTPIEAIIDTYCVINVGSFYGSNQDINCLISGVCANNLTFSGKRFIQCVAGIRDDGVVIGAGHNSSYNLGYLQSFIGFVALDGKFIKAQKVAGGNSYTFVVDEDGKLWGFGYNSYGSLGLGDTINRAFPVKYDSSFDNPLMIDCGMFHTVIVKSDGTTWVAGSNSWGQLGIGSSTNTFTKLSSDFNNPKKIACGDYHTFIVTQDGVVRATGKNTNGQLGVGSTTNKYSFIGVYSASTNPIHIATYSDFTFIVKSNGTVWATGYNAWGQLGLGDTARRLSFTQLSTSVNNPLAISCGQKHALLLKSDYTVWGTGDNRDGQLGLGSDAQKTSFTLITSNVTKIFANGYNSYIIKDNKFFATGDNYYKQLGLSDNTDRYTFTEVPCVTLAPAISISYQDTFVDLTFDVDVSLDTIAFLKNYSVQDTFLDIPNPTIVNKIDTFVTITAPMENYQDTIASCSFPISAELDTYLYSVFDNSVKHDTMLNIKRAYIKNYVLRNNLYVEGNLVIINSIIVVTIFYILNNFNDKKEKRYELINKFLLNDPMDIVVYLINCLTLSKDYVFSNSILDKYEKSIYLLNEIMVNLEQNCIINNKILDKFDNVCILLNEIKDSYELPFVLQNRLNDNVVKYLLINNNLEKYLNKEITLQNILEEAILGVVNQTYYDIFVSE